MTVTERMDQISAVTTAADDRQRIGQRRAKAQPLPAHRSEIGEYLACAALEKGNSRGIDGRGETAKLDCSRDPQPADHRREVEAEINWADRPFDQWNIHIEFDVIATLGVERDFVADLQGQGSRPGAGGQNDAVRLHEAIVTGQPDFPVALRLQSLYPGSLKGSTEGFHLGSHPPGKSGGIVDMSGIREEQAARHRRKRGFHLGDFGGSEAMLPDAHFSAQASAPLHVLRGHLFAVEIKASLLAQEVRQLALTAISRQAGIASFSKPASARPLRRAAAGSDCRTKRDSHGASAGKAAGLIASGLSELKKRLGRLRRTSGLPTGAQA